MTQKPLRDQPEPRTGPDTGAGGRFTPDPAVLRDRAVHRPAADLKRGTPVLLAGPAPLLILAAETAGARSLNEMAALALGPALLLLAPARAATVLARPVATDCPAVALRLPALLSDAKL